MAAKSSLFASSMLVPAAIIAVSAIVFQQTTEGRFATLLEAQGPPAATKPYDSFESFWPHYLAEHSKPLTKRLHYVGTALFVVGTLVTAPALQLCVAAGLAAGLAVSPFLRAQPSGAIEFATMLGTYVLTGRLVTGKFRAAILPMVIAYAFAWVGHFFVEHNKPATFIYPSYSLIGDFKMLFEAIRSVSF